MISLRRFRREIEEKSQNCLLTEDKIETIVLSLLLGIL